MWLPNEFVLCLIFTWSLEHMRVISALIFLYFDGLGTLPFVMAGVENTANYCFLSSLLQLVLNSNEVRNYFSNHVRFHKGNIGHSGKNIQNIHYEY